jgi:hypothetical protein
MGRHRLHFTPAARAILLGLLGVCASGGCWEEIEYTGPDPSRVARREPRPPTEPEPTGTVEPEASSGSSSTRPQPPPSEPELPTAATQPASEAPTSPPEKADELELTEEAPPDDLFAEVPEPEPLPEEGLEVASAPAELEPTESEPAQLEPAEPEPLEPEAEKPDPARATRLAAWRLGSRLTLAALANDRGVAPADAAKWFAEARAAAESLGTSIGDLPESAGTNAVEGGSRQVHDYLFQQGQRIWADLTDGQGGDHAALFEVAVRSNVLLVLYQPDSPHVDALATSIREAAPKAELPAKLWQPLLDTLADKPAAAAVRAAVRRMHADVENFLAEAAEQ